MKKLINFLTIFIFIFLISSCSCKDTIEERVRELLEKKQTVNNSILDEDNKELSLSETSTMDILGCL